MYKTVEQKREQIENCEIENKKNMCHLEQNLKNSRKQLKYKNFDVDKEMKNGFFILQK